MKIAADLRRLLTVFGGLATGLSVWMLTQTSSSDAVRGPIKSDDLPWGDLLTLNRNGAILFTIAAAVTLAAGLTGIRPVLFAAAGSWTLLTVIVGFVVATQGDLLGSSRGGTAGIAMAMMFVTLLPALAGEVTDEEAAAEAV